MWIILSVLLRWGLPGCAVSAHAAMWKSEPRGALLWIFAAFTLPILGPFLYLLIGINRIHRRTVRRLGVRGRPFAARAAGTTAGAPAYGESSGQFPSPLAGLRRVADHIGELPLLEGNRVEPLVGGEQAYPAMLGAIREAKGSITMAAYIFDLDTSGRQFVDELVSAARRGVAVYVLLDGVGALGSLRAVTRLLRSGGVEVEAFFPLSFPFGRFRVNLRNHRKILVIDGRIGFTGGMNISRRHLLRRVDSETSDDLHFRLEGPIVAELQHVNDEDWTLSAGRAFPADDRLYPVLEVAGDSLCRVIAAGPDQDERRVGRLVQAACASAGKTIRIATPYFLPSEAIMSHLIMASLRGAEVRVLIPERTDITVVRWAMDAVFPLLLRYGVQVRAAPEPFLHAKLTMVDGIWSLVGSSNLDPRSLRLNFECDVEVWDAAFHARMVPWFEERWQRSAPVTQEELDARPLWKRLRTGAARLLSPML